MFSSVVLHLPSGDLTVVAQNAGPQNIYVQSLTVNGQPVTKPFLDHSQLVGEPPTRSRWPPFARIRACCPAGWMPACLWFIV